MIISSLKIIISIIGLIALLILVRWLSKQVNLDPEWQRKLLHIGLGLFSLSFPFIFQDTWEVFLLCLASAFIMLCIRFIPVLRQSVGRSLYDVNRSSLGELLFALTIVLLFWLSNDRLVTYILPMLILTISDTAAAIIGVHYGRHTYEVESGSKSWQGSAAFAIFTFVVSIILLSQLSDLSFLHSLIIASILAWLGTLIEAVCWHGIDNLVVPLGLYLLLDRILPLDFTSLSLMLIILIILTGFGLIVAKKSQLNVHALMSSIITAFCVWVIGGITWLAPLVIVFITHLLMANRKSDKVFYDVRAILSVIFSTLPWLMIFRIYQYEYSYYFFLLTVAIHWQINVLINFRVIRNRRATNGLLLCISALATLFVLSILPLFEGFTPINISLVLSGMLILFIGGVLFKINAERFSQDRWLQQGIYALLGSFVGVIPLQMLVLI